MRLGASGEAVRRWRQSQPGEYVARNGQRVLGWSQERAAKFVGRTARQWRRYESGDTAVPLTVVKLMAAYDLSWRKVVDRVFETPARVVEEYGGVFPQLAHEKALGPGDHTRHPNTRAGRRLSTGTTVSGDSMNRDADGFSWPDDWRSAWGDE